MRSVKWLEPGSHTTAACLAVVIILAAQLFWLRAVSTQEIPPPKIDQEFSKQEKIYRSQGAAVPQGYVIDRGLSGYAESLPTGFCDALSKLGSSDRWLDIGAGEGQAILDYYTPSSNAQKCVRSGDKARAVAMSIEDRRTDKWRQQAANLDDGRMRYIFGKRLSNYSSDDLGKFKLITDVFGGFSYTEHLSLFVEKVLSFLEVGGGFFTLVPGVHLTNAKDKLGILYLTELEDAIGRPEKVCSWLKKATCVQVTCESKRDWKRPTELIHIQKICTDTSVPRMKLVEFEAGYPPTRRFQMEQ